MKISGAVVMAAGFFAFSSLAAAAADAPKPLRHLEYHFNVGVRGETTVRDSGIGGGPASGVGATRSGIADTGTITADYMGLSGDGGAIYVVSEKGRDERRAEPAQCLVYPNTNVICEDKTVYDEEIALLRTLGKDFTHVVPLDANHHWQYRETTPTTTEVTDYTIKGENGGIVDLSVEDLMKTTGLTAYEAKATGGIKYNRTAGVPTWISLQSISHTSSGSNRGETNLELTLQSDSLASAH